MRTVLLSAIATIILFGSAPGNAQPNDLGTPEELKKIYDDCIKPDQSKPEVEVGSNNKYALLCGKALSLPKPSYPREAREQKIEGTVSINIVVDEKGRAIWAKVVEGPHLLQDVSIKAACHVRYTPTIISGRAVKANGFVRDLFVS